MKKAEVKENSWKPATLKKICKSRAGAEMRGRVGGQSCRRHSISVTCSVGEEEICQLEERGSHYRVLRKRFAEIRDQTAPLRVRSSQ